MNRRTLLAGAGGMLAAAAVTEGFGSVGNSGEDRPECLQDDDYDSDDRWLADGETPESPGAREFLATVQEAMEELKSIPGDVERERVDRFSEAGEVWEIEYDGTPYVEERYLAEIEVLATAFASHRPAGISLKAASLHECRRGTWHVCADPADAYEHGEISRETFVDTVHETAENINKC